MRNTQDDILLKAAKIKKQFEDYLKESNDRMKQRLETLDKSLNTLKASSEACEKVEQGEY
jgi:hypothetical protein